MTDDVTNEFQEQVTALIATTIEESTGRAVELAADTALIDEGYLDSLTVLQIFMKLHEVFGVELDMEDLTEDAFGTPAAIANLVRAHGGQQP